MTSRTPRRWALCFGTEPTPAPDRLRRHRPLPREGRGTARGMPAGPSARLIAADASDPRHLGGAPLERAVGNGAGRTSKGTQAHGRSERSQTGNGLTATTDSSVEQGLEAARSRTETRPLAALATGTPIRSSHPARETQRRGGNGRSDAVRLLTRGTLRRVGPRREEARVVPGRLQTDLRARAEVGVFTSDTRSRNATNPRAGSGVQQTRGPAAEKAVEVVRIHADGTRRRDLETPTRWRARCFGGTRTGSGRSRANRRRGDERARPREEEPTGIRLRRDGSGESRAL